MTEHEKPIDLTSLRNTFYLETTGRSQVDVTLSGHGYTPQQRCALYAQWENDQATLQSEHEAWLQALDSRARENDRIDCNPIYLILDAVADSLRCLEETIHFQLDRLRPYSRPEPMILTADRVTELRQLLLPFVDAGLKHYQQHLKLLYDSLYSAEHVMHKLCPLGHDDDDPYDDDDEEDDGESYDRYSDESDYDNPTEERLGFYAGDDPDNL